MTTATRSVATEFATYPDGERATLPFVHTNGTPVNTLIIGSTAAGKTVLLDQLASDANEHDLTVLDSLDELLYLYQLRSNTRDYKVNGVTPEV